jgi:hypothetical protein
MLFLTLFASRSNAATIFFGPTPYLSSADIPVGFFSGGFSLENFEDGTLDFGITASGVSHFILAPSGITDSVDADDGVIDGTGQSNPTKGYSYVGDGSPGLTFTFSGPLPTAAALVWTDGAGFSFPTTFEAFGPGMVSLGFLTVPLGIPGSYYGDAAEDRFFGVQDPGGILALRIVSPGGQVEADHVMFGTAALASSEVPEPATLLLCGAGLVAAARRRAIRRRL